MLDNWLVPPATLSGYSNNGQIPILTNFPWQGCVGIRQHPQPTSIKTKTSKYVFSIQPKVK